MSEPTTFDGTGKADAAATREFREGLRERVVVICPDNDPEAHLIIQLAEQLGLTVIKSEQSLGAELDKEPDVLAGVDATGKAEVWVVEMPGTETEEALQAAGKAVRVIDHHFYFQTKLDRSKDGEGEFLPSSLDQFMVQAQATNEDIEALGYEPKIFRGIGIMDARYIQGLRDERYAPDEINKVISLARQCRTEIDPEYAETITAAEEAWGNRRQEGGYTIVESDYPKDIRPEVALQTVFAGVDTEPVVISVVGGEKTYVQNVSPDITERLSSEIEGRTFTFANGRCWGVDNVNNSESPVSLERVLEVLGSE